MAKGGNEERKVARQLTEWLTGEKNPPVLWRSNLSGGWPYRDVANTGDLRPNGMNEKGVEFRRRFSVEVKAYKNHPKFWHLFSSPDPKILQWWEQATEDCEDYPTLCPMLVIHRNYRPKIVGLPYGFPSYNIQSGREVMELPRASVRFTLFEDFLAVETENMYNMWQEWADGRET